MEDIQLAMVVARLYESDFESSSTCKGILYERVLGCQRDGSGFSSTKLHPDPFLRSIAFWIMKDYTRALDTLLEQVPKEGDESQGKLHLSTMQRRRTKCHPSTFQFYLVQGTSEADAYPRKHWNRAGDTLTRLPVGHKGTNLPNGQFRDSKMLH